jgi:hypothetical protein
MNRKPEHGFDPSSPLLRKAFAVVAVAATFATAISSTCSHKATDVSAALRQERAGRRAQR